MAQDRAVETRYVEIATKLAMVTKMLGSVLDANLRAASFFHSEIESVPTLRAISPSRVAEARDQTAEAHNAIGALTSVFDSLRVGEPDADAIIAKFPEDLTAMDQLMIRQEQVLVAIQAGDLQTASSRLRKIGSDPEGKLARQLNTFDLRTGAFGQMAQAKRLEYQADLEARRVRRSDYQKRIYLLALSTAYMGAFLVVIVRVA